jgi:hypothetical protein
MPRYRVTIRFGEGWQRYEVLDVEAADVPAALRGAADRFPAETLATADLVELRLQQEPEGRPYGAG